LLLAAPERRFFMAQGMIVRIIALALAVVVVGLIIMRRRSHKKSA
jgi:hypothetical protein